MKNSWITLIVVGFFALQSCAPVYVPNNTNVPLFTEKGEIQVAGYQGTNGTNLQAAVAVVDHLAVMGNFKYAFHDDEDPEKHRKQKLLEAGVGFYDTFGKAGRYEFYGGYGHGEAESYDYFDFFDEDEKVRAEGKYEKWFLQGNVGMGNNVIEGALSYRVSYISFYRFNESETTHVYQGNMEEIMMEPAITMKVGGEHVKFVTQFGLSFPFDDYARFDHQPLYFSIGILGKIPAW